MVLLMMLPQFYAVNVTGMLQPGEFPMNQMKERLVFSSESRVSKARGGVSHAFSEQHPNGRFHGRTAGFWGTHRVVQRALPARVHCLCRAHMRWLAGCARRVPDIDRGPQLVVTPRVLASCLPRRRPAA